MAEEITIESLQAELETANATITSNSETIAELEKIVEAKEKEIAEQTELIAEINKEVDALSKQKAVVNPIVKYDGKSYAIVIHRFSHAGEIITSAELENNEALIAELIEQGSGVLELID